MKNYNKMYEDPFIEPIEPITVEETVEETPVQEFGTVNAREVYIRKGPGKEFEHVGTVIRDEELIVLGREGDFLKIETQDGTVAYIMESFVTID